VAHLPALILSTSKLKLGAEAELNLPRNLLVAALFNFTPAKGVDDRAGNIPELDQKALPKTENIARDS